MVARISHIDGYHPTAPGLMKQLMPVVQTKYNLDRGTQVGCSIFPTLQRICTTRYYLTTSQTAYLHLLIFSHAIRGEILLRQHTPPIIFLLAPTHVIPLHFFVVLSRLSFGVYPHPHLHRTNPPSLPAALPTFRAATPDSPSPSNSSYPTDSTAPP